MMDVLSASTITAGLMSTSAYNTSWRNDTNVTDAPAPVAPSGTNIEDTIEVKILEGLETYVSPSLFFVAIIGNGLAFAVFASKEFRHSLTAMLYMILAVADTLVVVVYDGLHSIPSLFDVSIITYSGLTCKLFTFCYFTLKSLSAMVLVVIGLERFIGVVTPHMARVYNTKFNFLVILAFGTTVITANFLPLLSSTDMIVLEFGGIVYGKGCALTEGNPSLFWYGKVWFQWSNLVLSTFIPFALILFTNTGIIVGVLAGRKMRMATSASANTASNNNNKDGTMTLVYMLLTVSFAFIVLNIPFPVYFFLQEKYISDTSSKAYLRVLLLGSIAPILDSINHSINILVYFVCGRKFRRALLGILSCRGAPPSGGRPNQGAGRNHPVTAKAEGTASTTVSAHSTGKNKY